MPSASILGTGLIGASVGLGLSQSGWTVTGWDPDRLALRTALERSAIGSATASEEELLGRPADLIVLAAPPAEVERVVSGLSSECLVTDVAGAKANITSAGRRLARFVPGHPMAGREVSGPAAASAALFRGAAWALITDDASDSDVDEVAAVVSLLGARPLRMTAEEHDRAVAVISHLPQVLAAALVREAMQSTDALGLAAGSFRDLTRVAASDPDAWAGVLIANRAMVTSSIRGFVDRLGAWAGAIDGASVEELTAALRTARDARARLAAPVVAVGVALADRPGELAKVGHALEASGVDIRDLQLRHSPHGGGGLLSLFVRPGEAEALRAALAAEGLFLAD